MLLFLGLCLAIQSSPLEEFTNGSKSEFFWKHVETQEYKGGKLHTLSLISQIWQGKQWKHDLEIYEPKQQDYPGKAIFIITGNRSKHDEDLENAYKLGDIAKMAVVVLYDIPNQPLFGNLTEDGLMAYTFVKYLETQQPDWVLLFPMTRSVVRAMDAVSEYTKEKTQAKVDKFVLTGASKRGWTAYLVASVDKRIIGLAPMVFDMLRIEEQLKHQKELWGDYSPEFKPYVEAGLMDWVDKPQGKKLIALVDPYFYMRKMLMPKFLILGANDTFWALDALSLYWDRFELAKYVFYVPNSGHGLEDRKRVLNTLAAFSRIVASRRALPIIQWTWVVTGGAGKFPTTAVLKLDTPYAKRQSLWLARSGSTNFSHAKWVKAYEQENGSEFIVPGPDNSNGYRAVIGEAEFEIDGIPYWASTLPLILRGG